MDLTPKQKFVNEILKSLNEDWMDWSFDNYTAKNIKSGIEIWITNIPILDLSLYRPTKINFSLIDRFRIYKALDNCRALKLIHILESRGSEKV